MNSSCFQKEQRSNPTHDIPRVVVGRYANNGNAFCQKQHNGEADAAQQNDGCQRFDVNLNSRCARESSCDGNHVDLHAGDKPSLSDSM
jgi:hypothetical protein